MCLLFPPLSSSISLAQSSSWKKNFKGKQSDDCSKTPKQISPKFSASTKCYRCQGYGHIAANCSREIKITFVHGAPIQAPESDEEEVTYHSTINEDDDSDYDQEDSDAECNYIQLTPQITYLSFSVCSHKRRIIGEELISFKYSLRLERRIRK